jgi:hypothetical protein
MYPIMYAAHIVIMELENESHGQIFGEYYTFDAKTIFREYDKGEENLFSVISDEELENLEAYPLSDWGQKEFLEALNLFHQTAFHQPLDEKLSGASFSLPNCNQITLGLQSAVIFTHNFGFSEGYAVYYSYYIEPNRNFAYWHGDSYEPIISWPISSLNLSKIKITAEEALQIAEKHGGEDIRLTNQNQCDIDIDISADEHHGNWVVSYNSTIDKFTSLLRIEVDSTTGKTKVLTKGGAGSHIFDSQNILTALSQNKTDIFKAQIIKPSETVDLPPVTWTQVDFYRIAKAFNEVVLNEELDQWDIRNISFNLDCDDAMYGPQQMRFTFVRLNLLNGDYSVQDIDINPRTNILKWSNEYDHNVNRKRLAEWKQELVDNSWIKISANDAMRTVYEEEGKKLHLALKNGGKKCQMSGWLSNFSDLYDADTLEWHIMEWKRDYQILGEEDTQLSAFVNLKTGEMRFFRFYGNQNP